MRDFASVAVAVARRNLTVAFKNPALIVPATIFPLVFLLAFAGGLSGLANVPGFDFPSGYTSFQFVFVFIQSAAFGGVFTGFAVAADFESGFARRLMLAAPRRTGLIAGYVIAGIGRYVFTAIVITVAGLLAGMEIDGSGADFGGLLVLGVLVNITATLFGVGLCMRTQSVQSVPFLQIPVFLLLFLAPVYVPLDLLQGWIASVAPYNPATALLQAGRGFISGEHESSLLAFAVGAGLVTLLGTYAVRGLRRAEAGV